MTDIKIDNVLKILVDEGDMLLVTLPESSLNLPIVKHDDMLKGVAHAFEELLHGKRVKIMVVPYGMQVQIIKSSDFDDA